MGGGAAAPGTSAGGIAGGATGGHAFCSGNRWFCEGDLWCFTFLQKIGVSFFLSLPNKDFTKKRDRKSWLLERCYLALFFSNSVIVCGFFLFIFKHVIFSLLLNI